MTKLTIQKILEITEGCDLEVKEAAGQDGKGKLPASFFPTYSAMTNTKGGIVLLGVKQLSNREFGVTGVVDTQKVTAELWSGLNNRQQASMNLLRDDDVTVLDEFTPAIIQVKIPQASREHRPVFIGGNPLTGTYRRNGEGDYRCTEEVVKRMLADQSEDATDGRILSGYSFADLEIETFNRYRTVFNALKPTHPFAGLPADEFLRSIGGWAKDRQTDDEGVTVAGLLMFGKLHAILEAVPNYVVDYRELPRAEKAESKVRWLDRLTTDFSWSGNLYDFYRLVSRKLAEGLKVPFRMEGTTRIDDTPVHEALRDALVNCLIHADYRGRLPILVIKRPDMIGFRNPGMMLIPAELAVAGGNSVCRNRKLQKMFQFIGEGEQAGSGVPKIYRNWAERHWRVPLLMDTDQPEDQTLLELRMVSLLRPETIRALERRFGKKLAACSDTERLALAAVAEEGSINHTRLKEICWEHPHDLSRLLARLVERELLDSDGVGRGTVYFFHGEPPAKPQLELLAGTEAGSSQHLPGSSQHLPGSSQHLPGSSQHLDELLPIAAPVREHKKVSKTLMRQTIVHLCRGRFFTVQELAELLRRKALSLQNHHLNSMVRQRRLRLKYPQTLTHPQQAYTATDVEVEE